MKKGYVAGLLLAFMMTLAVLSACSTPGGQRLLDMPLSDGPLSGKFVWHDLITDDIDRARQFYGDLMGWSFEDTRHPIGGEYTLILSGDRFVAGMVHLDDPAGVEFSRWLGYMSVADVDEAVRFNRAQGGSVAAGATCTIDVNVIVPAGTLLRPCPRKSTAITR